MSCKGCWRADYFSVSGSDRLVDSGIQMILLTYCVSKLYFRSPVFPLIDLSSRTRPCSEWNEQIVGIYKCMKGNSNNEELGIRVQNDLAFISCAPNCENLHWSYRFHRTRRNIWAPRYIVCTIDPSLSFPINNPPIKPSLSYFEGLPSSANIITISSCCPLAEGLL